MTTYHLGPGGVQVLGGIVYGGRITDAADMHVLVAMLRRFVGPELLVENFSFACDRVYSRPPVGSLKSYRYCVTVQNRASQPCQTALSAQRTDSSA